MRAHRARTLDEVPQSMLLRSAFQRDDRQVSTAVVEPNLLNASACNPGANPDSYRSTHPVTEFEYDGNGNVISVEDAEGRVTNYGYDALNRLVKVLEPAPGLSNQSHQYVTGQVLEAGRPVTMYVYDNLSNLRWVRDALGNDTFYHYDALSRPTAIIQSRPDSPFTPSEQADLLVGDKVAGAPTTRIDYSARPDGWHQTITREGTGTQHVVWGGSKNHWS